MSRLVLLSFDVEEFDIPGEYGRPVPDDVQFSVSATGLERVLDLLDRLGVTATFFTTALFALRHQALMRRVAVRHEVASHGYAHSSFADEDLPRSRLALEQVCAGPVVGFRRARMVPTDHAAILAAGYRYNSSENPVWLPGRHNNFFKRRTAWFSGELLNIPVSATPVIRFPLFWLSFKNFPLPAVQAAAGMTLAWDSYLNLYWHPWEFADIGSFGLPRFVARPDGQRLADRLGRYIGWLKRRADFTTFREFDGLMRRRRDGHGPGPRRT